MVRRRLLPCVVVSLVLVHRHSGVDNAQFLGRTMDADAAMDDPEYAEEGRVDPAASFLAFSVASTPVKKANVAVAASSSSSWRRPEVLAVGAAVIVCIVGVICRFTLYREVTATTPKAETLVERKMARVPSITAFQRTLSEAPPEMTPRCPKEEGMSAEDLRDMFTFSAETMHKIASRDVLPEMKNVDVVSDLSEDESEAPSQKEVIKSGPWIMQVSAGGFTDDGGDLQTARGELDEMYDFCPEKLKNVSPTKGTSFEGA
eukprot:TRINITY_DN17248_c0_g1_i1.p1 TRINITY_DN17248_c0_g1~~TRINITY_DN17248_c0_g1_i1.p1  ORF type:complete len:260 (-),score=59.27 TRINITY_DN17248_c0_g1_i1:283-1062(-)